MRIFTNGKQLVHISIHALLAESDAPVGLDLVGQMEFLSTLSLRRATSQPCCTDTTSAISIHALLAESDVVRVTVHTCRDAFLSTLSLRRATHRGLTLLYSIVGFLSTLSLRRATFLILSYEKATKNFYPRSPCGERPAKNTSMAGRITISIHALLAESDQSQKPVHHH